jgi:hypothetical protein
VAGIELCAGIDVLGAAGQKPEDALELERLAAARNEPFLKIIILA